jgi:hypothetical protein
LLPLELFNAEQLIQHLLAVAFQAKLVEQLHTVALTFVPEEFETPVQLK